MRARRPPVESPTPDRAGDGAVHLWRNRVLRVTLLVNVAALLFISASITIEAFYVKESWAPATRLYAAVVGVWMAAMVAGATGLDGRLPARRAATVALLALDVQGAAMAAQTAWAILPVAFAAYAVGGLGHGVKNTLLRLVVQERVPSRLHGRAFAAYSAARNAAELVALAAGGLLVAEIGPRPALLIAGLGPGRAPSRGPRRLAARLRARHDPRRRGRREERPATSRSSSSSPTARRRCCAATSGRASAAHCSSVWRARPGSECSSKLGPRPIGPCASTAVTASSWSRPSTGRPC